MRSKQIIFYLISSIVFLIVTLVLLVFVFPNVALKHLIEKSAEKQLQYKQRIQIGSLHINPLGSFKIKDLLVSPRQDTPEDPNLAVEGGVFDGYYCAPLVGADPFAVAELIAKPSISSLISKKPHVPFEIKLAQGSGEEYGIIDGFFTTKNDLHKLQIKADEISLNEFTLLSNLSKVQVHGSLNLESNVVLDKDRNIVDTNMNFDVNNTAMCPKRLKLNMGGVPFIELPFTRFGHITGSISLGEGQNIKIDKLSSDGPDLRFDISGTVKLKSKSNPEPILDLNVVIHPGEEWMQEHGMEILYRVCRKQPDGSIELHLSGSGKSMRKDCGQPIVEAAPMPSSAKAKVEEEVVNTENVEPAPKEPEKKPVEAQGAQRPRPEGRDLLRAPRGEAARSIDDIPLSARERKMIEADPRLKQSVLDASAEAEKARESRGVRRERPIGARPGVRSISEP